MKLEHNHLFSLALISNDTMLYEVVACEVCALSGFFREILSKCTSIFDKVRSNATFVTCEESIWKMKKMRVLFPDRN